MSLFGVKTEKKEKIAHFIAGFIILVHGYERYDLQKPAYIFFFIAGILFLSLAFFHHRVAHRFPYIDGVFFLIESFCYGMIAADFFHEGKKALPWCYAVVTIAYCIVGIIKAFKGKTKYVKREHE